MDLWPILNGGATVRIWRAIVRAHQRHSVAVPNSTTKIPPSEMPSESAGRNIVLLPLLLLIVWPTRGDNENYLTRDDVRAGQLFPGTVTTFAHETIFVRIVNAVDDQTECTFRRPGGRDVSVFAAATGGDEYVCEFHNHDITIFM